MLNEQQVQILQLIKERKNTSIDFIANEVFAGDREMAVKNINQMEKQKIVEYPVVNMIRISPSGKDFLNKKSGS